MRSRLPWPWRVVGLVVLAVVTGMWWWGYDFGQIFSGLDRSEIRDRMAMLESGNDALRITTPWTPAIPRLGTLSPSRGITQPGRPSTDRHSSPAPGTADVESDDNFPHNVFVHVPDGLLAYDGSQRELRGEHTWNDSHSELDVYRTETPGCKERRALHGSGVLPKNSVQKTLTWTLRKLGK